MGGGWLLDYLEELLGSVSSFDFRVFGRSRGITSLDDRVEETAHGCVRRYPSGLEYGVRAWGLIVILRGGREAMFDELVKSGEVLVPLLATKISLASHIHGALIHQCSYLLIITPLRSYRSCRIK